MPFISAQQKMLNVFIKNQFFLCLCFCFLICVGVSLCGYTCVCGGGVPEEAKNIESGAGF